MARESVGNLAKNASEALATAIATGNAQAWPSMCLDDEFGFFSADSANFGRLLNIAMMAGHVPVHISRGTKEDGNRLDSWTAVMMRPYNLENQARPAVSVKVPQPQPEGGTTRSQYSKQMGNSQSKGGR